MATRTAAPGGFSAAYAASAQTGDEIVMTAGDHTTSGSRLTIAKSLIIRAEDWNATTGPGKYVTGATGHTNASVPTRWTGGWQFQVANIVVRGILFNGTMTGGAGHLGINANDITFEDCVITDDGRYIGSIIGGGSVIRSRITFRRCRFRGLGERSSHDHPLYFQSARDCLVEDCIFYNNTGWAFHLYSDCDNLTVRRCVVDRSNSAVVFSSEGSAFSTNNVIEDSILTHAKGYLLGGTTEVSTGPRYLVDFFDPSARGVNYVRRSCVYNPVNEGGILGAIASTPVIQVTARVNADPLYSNPTGGDFTLATNSPALGMGPTYIQPGNSPGPPPPAVTNFDATAQTGPTRVELTWTLPASMTNRVLNIYKSTTGFVTDTASATPLASGVLLNLTDTDVVADTTYFYSGFIVEGGSLVSAGAFDSVITGPGDPPPPPDDPTNGRSFIGNIVVGTTWRGMSGDYKRGSVFPLAASKRIIEIGAYLRGVGTSGTHSIRPFVYNDATGALLGVCQEQAISNTAAEDWVAFTPSSAIVGPPNGGQVRVGLHTSTGDVQVATTVQPNALVHGSDTYSGGADASWLTPSLDQYLLSIYAIIEDVPATSDLSAASTWTWTSTADIQEVPPASTIPASDVVYRMDTQVITYQIPTPYQVSTGSRLRWDGTKFVYAEVTP